MPRNILITGTNDLLGGHLAARQLISPDDRVFYLVQTSEESSKEAFAAQLDGFIRRCAQRRAGETGRKAGPSAAASRLTVIATGPDDNGTVGIDKNLFSESCNFDAVWYFRGGHFPSLPHQRKHETAQAFASKLAGYGIGFTELNYVQSCYVPTAVQEPAIPWEDECTAVLNYCTANNIVCRIFRTSLIIGESGLPGSRRNHPLLQFLAVLHDFKSEIEERLAEYFDYQSLRCYAMDSPDLNLISAEQAAELMLRIADQGAPQGEYLIASRQNIPFTELCNSIGRAFGLSLKRTGNRDLLNAVDLLFEQRVSKVMPYLAASPQLPAEALDVISRMGLQAPLFDEQLQVAMFRLIRRVCFRIRAARDLRAADLSATLEKKSIDRDGSALNYYVGGSGNETIVILNALGHGLHYWRRLIDYLLPRYRIVIWELRGTVGMSQPFRIVDQLDDLESILHQERIDTCHLVGWCTGAKVALEFYHRRPSVVSSMVFLNSTFNFSGGSAEFKTLYERDFEPLCQIVSDRPQTAASVMQSLRASIADSDLSSLEELDSYELAASVLTMTNSHLKSHVLAPFRDEATTVNYSRQVIDFLSHNASTNAERIQAPILMVASEYDRIASPAGARAMASLFPRARYVELQGATHYCLYDCPELIGQLVQAFVESPDSDAIDHLLQ